ncbi:MAG: hypothetical protein KGL39_51645 [Patescibacteria group bacterium]|nr:hypothetical protein [Patescibacteria group bacterium]
MSGVKQCRGVCKGWYSSGSFGAPRGYCSLRCWVDRKLKPQAQEALDPHVCLFRLHQHLVLAYKAESLLLPEFDCAVCERLEAEYARSLGDVVEPFGAPVRKVRTA